MMISNNIRRRLVLITVVFCLAFLLSACGSNTSTTTFSTTSTSTTTTTTTTVSSQITTTKSINPVYAFFGAPGLIPEIFSPGFISTESNYEFAGTFSPDLTDYFFTRRSLEGTNRLFYTTFVDGEWSLPTLSPISEDIDEFEPFITPNGSTIYFASKRDNHNDYVFYMSDFLNGSWKTPVYVENGLNDAFAMYVSVSTSGNIYFTGLSGIYVIRNIEGEFQPREYTGVYGTHPYIAPDESYMLIDKRSGSSSYIYISFNIDDDWSIPIKLGEEVNQVGAEQICSSISPDGNFLFFSRFVEGSSDIYWVDAAYLDQYRD